MRSIAARLLFVCGLLATPLLAQDGARTGATDPALEAALRDLQQRDPEAFETFRRALAIEPERAGRMLAQHERYRLALAQAASHSPEQHRRLLEQEEMERGARELLQRYEAAPDGTPEREAALEGLRAQLFHWFEVRQALRAFHIEEFSQQKTTLEAGERDPETARQGWLERIVRGGGGEPGPQAIDPPAIVQAVMRRDPEMGMRLARLAEEAPEEFRRRIEEIVRTSPELVEEARRAVPEAKRVLEAALRDAIHEAARLLAPLRGQEGPVSVPESDEVRAALQVIVDAERAIVRAHLEDVERHLREARATLEFRRQHADEIVDLQLSRMIGRGDRYEW